MPVKTYRASDFVPLTSDVRLGGGEDVTEGLQAILDRAKTEGGVHLVMDGAARVSGLRVYSNTTVECLTRDCGFFQTAGSDCALITNADRDFYRRNTRNVRLLGGTYNQDCLRQRHDRPTLGEEEERLFGKSRFIFALEFYGIEHLELRDLTVRNFRTFAVTVGGFQNVTIENVWLDLPDRMHAQNQDGFHFWGPGRFLTVRNVGGRVGDDFMNVGPDELDLKSSISDVLVDGVFLDDADQAIRLLSRGTGRLDRVTLRNISGTYRSFGFYFNCWFPGETFGDFGNIFVENVDLRQTAPNYDYRAPMLFSVGGNVESLTVKNLRHHKPRDGRALFELGLPSYDLRYPYDPGNMPRMENVEIEGLTVIEDGPDAAGAEYIQVFLPMERLSLKNVTVLRKNLPARSGHLLSVKEGGGIALLAMHDVFASGFETLIDGEARVGEILSANVISRP
ncbi:MAG: hypothetical protein IKX85_05900 [Clostridia bacterium]|nr:hypothetical protein [Clostridia bacterium]